MIIDIIYLPVHNSLGFNTAGIGNSPLNYSFHIIRFMTYSLERNVSLWVNKQHPNNESCTIPMTGWLFLGVTIYRGTCVKYLSSADVSYDYGTCIFISSPSKSAL